MNPAPSSPEVPRAGAKTVRVIGVLLILPILAFACFGLVATLEPMEGGGVWLWRGAYMVLVLGCLLSIVRFLRMK